MPTFVDEGDTASALTVTAGSSSAVSPFVPDPKKDRAWLLQNPHSTCDLFVGFTSTFTAAEAHWFIPSSSGSIAGSSHQQLWLIYQAGCSSQTVTGVVFKQ